MSLFHGHSSKSSILLGAAFLMATSAIGPGFITQTTVFTQQAGTSFGFVILCSVILDIVVQLNIWRIISVSGLRANELTNQFLPGSGHLLSLLIVIGGLAFNIGNVGGAALGLQVLFGLEIWQGVAVSTAISLFIFWYREAGKAMDIFAKSLGIAMIVLMIYIVVVANPPVAAALHRAVFPEHIDSASILILVGGTVGGYISFAGVHRLVDAGISGPANVAEVSRNSVRGIFIATSMRVLLFLAALGVVTTGVELSAENPASSVFQSAAGNFGYIIFGLILWAASITSVVGSAYTSVSFLKVFSVVDHHYRIIVSVFILFSAGVFLYIGRPVKILIIVGALNALVLPIALALILLISRKARWMASYKHPIWLTITGWVAVVLLLLLSMKTMVYDLANIWK